MKHKWHLHTIYISLLFLLLALYKNHFLVIPEVHSTLKVIISFVLLFIGFVLSAISQQRFLTKGSFHISILQSIAMVGLNIFTKYIPGKVMTVMGKALHLSETKGYPVLPLSVLFLKIQIITLWCGMMLAIFGLFFHHAMIRFSWIGLSLFCILSIVIFSQSMNDLCTRMLAKVLRKPLALPNISIGDTIRSIHWFAGTWLLWGFAFYFLVGGLSENYISLPIIFCFPFAGTIGIIALFSPGGIGIRESIIVGYLTSLNVDLPIAITLSAVSRIWFLIGECFIFMLGYWCRKYYEKSKHA